jgi:hypothetical protein
MRVTLLYGDASENAAEPLLEHNGAWDTKGNIGRGDGPAGPTTMFFVDMPTVNDETTFCPGLIRVEMRVHGRNKLMLPHGSRDAP